MQILLYYWRMPLRICRVLLMGCRHFVKVWAQFNAVKTEVVVFQPASDLDPYNWSVGGSQLPQGTQFKYLGLIFRQDCTFDALLAARVHSGKLCWFRLELSWMPCA